MIFGEEILGQNLVKSNFLSKEYIGHKDFLVKEKKVLSKIFFEIFNQKKMFKNFLIRKIVKKFTFKRIISQR